MTNKSFAFILGVIFCLILTSVIGVHAQCDSTLQAVTTAGGYSMKSITTEGDTLTYPVETWSAKFIFTYESDSSYNNWSFYEFLINRRKLFLSNWCNQRVINYNESTQQAEEDWTPEALRSNSTTKIFPVHAGDTLQFYRELFWIDRVTMQRSFDMYKNSETISYSVELVNAETGNRILQIDTFSIEANQQRGKVGIYSWYPMASRIRCIVPPCEGLSTAFIRINTYAAGPNRQPFVRKDQYSPMMSDKHLASLWYLGYNDSVEVNNKNSHQASCEISVSETTTPGTIKVGYNWPSTTVHNITIYTVGGAVVWSAPLPLPSNPLPVVVPPGLLIVVGSSNGLAVCTRKAYVPAY